MHSLFHYEYVTWNWKRSNRRSTGTTISSLEIVLQDTPCLQTIRLCQQRKDFNRPCVKVRRDTVWLGTILGRYNHKRRHVRTTYKVSWTESYINVYTLNGTYGSGTGLGIQRMGVHPSQNPTSREDHPIETGVIENSITKLLKRRLKCKETNKVPLKPSPHSIYLNLVVEYGGLNGNKELTNI